MNTPIKNTPPHLSSRVLFIDYAKALGMFLIIWGHTKLTGISNEFVYAFHIPLFFCLSGMVFNKERYENLGHFLTRKVQTLLVPYVVFSVLTWMLWAGYSYFTHADVDSLWNPLLQTFLAQGSGGFLEHNVPLWFVTCLFVVELMYWFVSELKDVWNIVTCVVLAIISYCLVNYCDIWDFKRMPWSIDVAMMAIPFFSLGHLLAKHVPKAKMLETVNSHLTISWILVAVGFAITAYCGHLNGAASMGHARLGHNPIVFYITACVGTMAMLVLCILLEGMKGGKIWKQITEKLLWFGRHSFDAMAIHNPIRQVVMVVVAIVLHTTSDAISENTIHSLISFIITLCITIIGMMVIEQIRNRIKLQDIVGKK